MKKVQNPYTSEKYVQLCSEKTLLVEEKGFFHDFITTIFENVDSNWVEKVFGKLTNNYERIRTIYDYEPIAEIIAEVFGNVQEIYRGKNDSISRKRIIEAQEEFRNGNNLKALALYSQSVLKAPKKADKIVNQSSTYVANSFMSQRPYLPFWGRSKVLVALHEFGLALRDLQTCLREGLPELLQFEAYWSMAICYKALNQPDRAGVAQKLAEKLADTAETVRKIRVSMRQTHEAGAAEPAKRPPKIKSCGKVINSKSVRSSNKITLRFSPEVGRFVAALADIATGEALTVEEPFAACLFPERSGSHCHHCFERLVAPVACAECSGVAFCSPECRAAASVYHGAECKYLDLLIGSGMSALCLLALRIVTQLGPEAAHAAFADRKTGAFALCTHEEKRHPDDMLKRALMAAFLLRCLQKTGFFPGRDPAPVRPSCEQEYKIAEMLLFNLQMLQFNVHEIFETVRAERWQANKVSNIAVAVYPTVALYNHECSPGVGRFFVGKTIVTRALRPLRNGDTVAENYGPVYVHKDLSRRQSELAARYWFDCRCVACLEKWPSALGGLEDSSKRIRCSNQMCHYLFTLPLSRVELACPNCKETVNLDENLYCLKEAEHLYGVGFGLMNLDKFEEAEKILCEAIDQFYKVSAPPHSQTYAAQEALRTCWAQTGNTFSGPH